MPLPSGEVSRRKLRSSVCRDGEGRLPCTKVKSVRKFPSQTPLAPALPEGEPIYASPFGRGVTQKAAKQRLP